jgi:voltage-gated potassium channel Kch
MSGPRRPPSRPPGPLRTALAGLRPFGNVQILAAVTLAAALILGYLGLWQYLSARAPAAQWGNSWDDILFYDLQLPVLSAAPVQAAGDFPVTLSVARFLAPVGTFVAALAALELVLGDQLRSLRAARARGHAVVAGEGPVALALARHFTAEASRGPDAEPDHDADGIRGTVLVSASEDTLTLARHYGILTVRGDPADPATLRAAGAARAAEVYACTATGTANAAIALRARDIAAEARRARPLSVYAMVRDAELGVALRARRIGARTDPSLRLDFFGVEQIAARKLFDAHPLGGADDRPAVIVVVGFGPLGRAVLREAARRRAGRPGSPRAEVFVRQAPPGQAEKFIAAFPSVGENCSLAFGEDPVPPAAGGYTVFVCVDDDDRALREGLAMAHALASQRGRVVVCLRESSPFADILASDAGLLDDIVGRITVFGVIESACVPAVIREDFIEQIARAVHRDYRRQADVRDGRDAEGKLLNPGSLLPWRQLSADLKKANVGQALSFGPKLEAVRAVAIPESTAVPGFAFSDQEVEDLAVQEHERWMSERISQGWRHGERDDRLKLNPALLPWPELPQAQRVKSREAVRAIPAILRDAGFGILRLPPS